MELLSKGEINQSEIARILQVDKSIICRDIAYLRQQAKEPLYYDEDEDQLGEEQEEEAGEITSKTTITNQVF